MGKFWNKKTIGIIGAILVIITLTNTFLLIGFVTGLIDLSPKEPVVEEEILPTTYLIEFDSDYSGFSINADDVYFPGDTIEVDVEVTEENSHGVVVYVVWSAISPMGGVTIECTPPNSEIEYTTIYEDDDQMRNYHMALYGCMIEKPFEWSETYETDAYSLEEASDYANATYSTNSSIGTWHFKMTFQSGCLKYLILGAEAEVWSYLISCREKEEDDTSEET